MNTKSSNPYFHILYWIFVILVISLVFGTSWGNRMAAFYFVSMLLPIVLGTSYFFNYFLVPKYYLKKKYVWFGLYTFYAFIVSLYLESIVIMFSFIYLGNFNFQKLGPNASDTILLAVIMYLLVFVGSLLLMARQIKENQQIIHSLRLEKEKMEKAFLEVISNRKTVKIPYDDIVYIESLSDYIKINTSKDQIISKEKISTLASELPEMFIRIHRSFIVNKNRITAYSYTEVLIEDISLNIGRSYRNEVREVLGKRKGI
ncbi:MAG: LytTR family transcriptional regulator [Bacteroidales bacterium]|nr:LytTR family transcriptional regulator [Bacteroidales bacterium]